jgi:hypothetical protein
MKIGIHTADTFRASYSSCKEIRKKVCLARGHAGFLQRQLSCACKYLLKIQIFCEDRANGEQLGNMQVPGKNQPINKWKGQVVGMRAD